jgi:hypothetical protein
MDDMGVILGHKCVNQTVICKIKLDQHCEGSKYASTVRTTTWWHYNGDISMSPELFDPESWNLAHMLRDVSLVNL